MNRLKWIVFLAVLFAIAFLLPVQAVEPDCCEIESGESGTAACCTKDGQAENVPAVGDSSMQMQHGGHGRTGQGGRMGRSMGGMGLGAVMPDAMRLLHNYTSLRRTSEDIPDGVRSVTTTEDSRVLDLLRRHPREMYKFYQSGGIVRPHDPVFLELSRVADKVTMEFKDIEDGIEVTMTSDDPEVVKLIRAHARKIDEFVKRGAEALHEGAPLPEDYHPAN